ncbi:DEAD/DEAH box helicase [uncultured Acetatifactor sp.]|uniref:DEAD/DEAH box helicase n=1 Tax=uncultured Acetatifactor sp. TaxID=1671927 RepID=UPI0026028854|nr:DEAD/DEAH box helicase [uncultured Acetatifactor sp.]
MNEWNNAPTEEMSAEQKLTERQDEAVQTQEAAEREEQAEAAQMTGEAERNTAELPESGEDSAEACPEDVEEASEKGAAPETEEVADGDAEPREEATEEWDASKEDMADGFEDTEDTDQAETEEVSAEEEDMAAEDTGAAAEGNTVAARPETKPDGSGEEAVDSASLASIEPLLDDRIVRAVREMGFEKLTPIQVQAIPYLLDGEDIIGQAQTGTGKTAAFAIPALQKIDPDLRKLQTIILCPTRELAMQAAEEIRNIAKFMHGIKVLPVYGGQDISKQIRGLKDVQIVVGTPGRVMDHMRRRTMKLDYVNMVVLDEADEMLDMGFREDMELILGEVPNAHQTALFSATMPQPILEIANRFQKDARLVRVAAKELTIPLVSQRYYRVKSHDKDAACIRLLEYYQPKLCLIFCNTKIKVDEVSELLKKAEFRAEGLHGDMSQHQRDVAMNHFRNGSTNILIATDVAARGIDVDNVEVVINYDVPQDNEYYVHRIGRTGRAGKTGRSFTFVSGRELFRLRQIERFCHTTIEERELPNASKVMKAKAEKYLNRSWELHGRDDIDLMKSYVERKMEEEGCDALELAAAMLKYHIGDIGPEIEVDDYEARGGRGDRGRGRGRRRGGREENREGRRRRERDEERRGRDRDGERDSRRRRERDEERRSRDRDEERESRRSFERDEERESRRSRDRDEERDSRRSFERDEERDSRRSFDRGEERDSRQGFGHDEEREGRRSFDREEEREGRRRRDREEERGDRDSRVRFGWGDDRGSRRKRDREDDRDSRRRRDREESRDDRGRRGRDNDRDSRRGRDRGEERVHGRFERESSRDSRRRGREEERDSRRKRDREESRPSRLRDVRMDGSDRGLAFSFPKKKRK